MEVSPGPGMLRPPELPFFNVFFWLFGSGSLNLTFLVATGRTFRAKLCRVVNATEFVWLVGGGLQKATTQKTRCLLSHGHWRLRLVCTDGRA